MIRRAQRAARRAARTLFAFDETRVYRMPAAEAAALADGGEFGRDRASDLAHYAPDEPWHPPPEEFRREAERRLAAGHHAYTLVDGGRLVHYCWLTVDAPALECDYGPRWFSLPPRSATLWDDNTVRQARGRGLHTRGLRRRARDAAREPGTEWVYVGVRADNWPSRKNIERVGFRVVAHGFTVRVFGVPVRWFRPARPERVGLARGAQASH